MSLLDRFNLGLGFQKYFEILPAIDDATRNQVYRVRHEVYCEDLHFEPERPDRREIDDYDAQSLHCLLRTSTEPYAPVGCVRLVLCDPAVPDEALPFERTCAHTLDRRIIDPALLPRTRIAEVSRLAVRGSYRRRRGEDRQPVSIHEEDFGTKEKPRFPYVPISLYMGAIALAHRNDIDTLFVLTEPRLANHFAKLGVDIRQIGGAVEHRGARIPSMLDVKSVIKNMRFILRPIWRVVAEQIDAGLAQASVAGEPMRNDTPPG
ncbi:MAG TPA: PEP-CTERM/exosortase system-associated acyltransferase [Rhodocyclaceae bacterium]|nr:PEP-CTERM/exosortase system-associated acyltransferase [Rhodocyclaceae bacterium]